MVEVACETDFVARTDDFKSFTRDIAMHIAAASPVCIERDSVDTTMIEKEREIFRQQAINDGKPEKIVDKIVNGKIEKYMSEIVLMEQAFVKDNDKSIADLLKEKIGKLGENIQIKRFSRFRLGE